MIPPHTGNSTPVSVHRSRQRRSSPSTVSLNTPRPEASRAANIYSEPPQQQKSPSCCRHAQSPESNLEQDHQLLRIGDSSEHVKSHQLTSPVVVQQPLKKPPPASSPFIDPGRSPSQTDGWTTPAVEETASVSSSPSFVCARCGRCRCSACSPGGDTPQRRLPCRHRADSCVDAASCMCCVLAVSYHCCSTSTDSGSRRVDHPCSCSSSSSAAALCLHWSWLTAVSAVLPCLCCYWPLRGCVNAAECVYVRATTRSGCRCPPDLSSSHHPSSRSSPPSVPGHDVT